MWFLKEDFGVASGGIRVYLVGGKTPCRYVVYLLDNVQYGNALWRWSDLINSRSPVAIKYTHWAPNHCKGVVTIINSSAT